MVCVINACVKSENSIGPEDEILKLCNLLLVEEVAECKDDLINRFIGEIAVDKAGEKFTEVLVFRLHVCKNGVYYLIEIFCKIIGC